MSNEEQNGFFARPVLSVVRFLNEISDRKRANKMIAKLHTLPKENWLAYDRQFNRWEFPMDFREFTPSWWGKKERWYSKRKMAIISPLMEIVMNEFGYKEQLRYHNVFKGKMTNAEFEYWYENKIMTSSKNRTDEAFNKYYDRRRKLEELEWWKDDVYVKLSTVLGW
jgi:hypothetical protein